MSSQMFVEDIGIGDSIIYKCVKYKIDNIFTEGGLKTLILSALINKRSLVCILCHPKSTISWSKLDTTTHKVIKYVSGITFEIEGGKLIDLVNQHELCKTNLTKKKDVYVLVHTCFGDTFPGIIYTST
jgi:hypothetical protein